MQSNNQKSMHLTTAGALILDKMLPCGRAKNYIDFSHFLKKINGPAGGRSIENSGF